MTQAQAPALAGAGGIGVGTTQAPDGKTVAVVTITNPMVQLACVIEQKETLDQVIEALTSIRANMQTISIASPQDAAALGLNGIRRS